MAIWVNWMKFKQPINQNLGVMMQGHVEGTCCSDKIIIIFIKNMATVMRLLLNILKKRFNEQYNALACVSWIASCLLQNNNMKQLNFVCLNVNYEVHFSFVCFAFLFGMLHLLISRQA